MAKQTAKDPKPVEILDRLKTMEQTMAILGVSESHVYMLEKCGKIQGVDISVNGNGGPKTRRYSLVSINAFIESRKIDALTYSE